MILTFAFAVDSDTARMVPKAIDDRNGESNVADGLAFEFGVSHSNNTAKAVTSIWSFHLILWRESGRLSYTFMSLAELTLEIQHMILLYLPERCDLDR